MWRKMLHCRHEVNWDFLPRCTRHSPKSQEFLLLNSNSDFFVGAFETIRYSPTPLHGSTLKTGSHHHHRHRHHHYLNHHFQQKLKNYNDKKCRKIFFWRNIVLNIVNSFELFNLIFCLLYTAVHVEHDLVCKINLPKVACEFQNDNDNVSMCHYNQFN